MTDPYYTDSNITLYNGDCLNITAWLTANVLVTDPPYGIDFKSGQRQVSDPFDRIVGDTDLEVRGTVLDMWPCTKEAAVFGTWRARRPRNITQLLVWHKHGAGPGMGNLNTAFGTCHEEIYLLGPWPKQDTTRRRGSVITTTSSPNELANRVRHPTPKPVGVLEQLITAAPSGAVADPFAGAGSTLLAARNLGRPAIGVEINERYCELAAQRLDQMILDLS